MLRYVLLALIAESGPLHGYALMKAFAARSGVRLSIGNIYRELQRLREAGHIRAVENPADADPRRAPYAITDAGKAAVASWCLLPAESFLRDPVDPLYCRLALLADAEASHSLSFLDDLEATLAQQRRSAERRQQIAGNEPILQILLGRRSRRLAADIEVVGQIRDALVAAAPRRARAVPRAATDRKPPKLDRRVASNRVGR